MLAEIAYQFEEEEKINFDWKDIKSKQRTTVSQTGLIVRIDRDTEEPSYHILHYSFH